MNPTKIVQQNIGVPASSLTDAGSIAHVDGKAKPVAAIIRPKPRDTGNLEFIRLEAAETNSLRPHDLTEQLNDYVKWLREQFEQEESDQNQEVAAKKLAEAQSTTAGSHVNPIAAETVQGPGPSHQQVASDNCFETISMETVVPDKPSSSPSENPESRFDTKADAIFHTPARGFSTEKLDRVDPPHAELAKAYAAFDELKVQGDGSPTVSFESDLTDSVPSMTKKTPQPKKLSVEETEGFIATISKAIASVLTETPEPEFEQRVRAHFESELQARAARTIAPSETEPTDINKLDHAPVAGLADSSDVPVAELKSKADEIAREILTSARKEIPTSAVAWDVEDFRWPVITNQMIVSGGESLDQISRTAFETIAPGRQRIAIAGLGRGEGTTSIAISLARWAAACGKNVLLVDADLVSPGLSTQVGLAPNISWINAVSQSLPSAEVIVRSQKSNLCIMPLAQMVSRVTWPRFIYDNLGELIEQVQNQFDIVLIDVGPANQLMAELSRPSLLADASLLVYNGVDSSEFQKTKSRLEVFGLSKLIVAQNRAKQKSVNVA